MIRGRSHAVKFTGSLVAINLENENVFLAYSSWTDNKPLLITIYFKTNSALCTSSN
jgi:hypothetical protein